MDNQEDRPRLPAAPNTSDHQQAFTGSRPPFQRADSSGVTRIEEVHEGPSINQTNRRTGRRSYTYPRGHRSGYNRDHVPLAHFPTISDYPTSAPFSIRDGYTPGNPYNLSLPSLTDDSPSVADVAAESATLPQSRPTGTGISSRKKSGLLSQARMFCARSSIRAFNTLLLFLPLLYYSRVTEIFKEVQCSGERLKDAIKENIKRNRQDIRRNHNQEGGDRTPGSANVYYDLSRCPPEVENLKRLWNTFLDAVTKEWEIMNIVAVLLLTAIISSMQIGPVFANEVVRYIGFAALVSGLMSLIYSCTYIIRFSIMRPVHKAVEWAKEGEATKTAPFWNVWIFLSIPAIWLSWSLILFVAEIIAFIWLVDSPESVKVLSPGLRLAARIAISVLLAAGVTYLVLILSTLRRYGVQMDHAWITSINRESDTFSTHTSEKPVHLRRRDTTPDGSQSIVPPPPSARPRSHPTHESESIASTSRSPNEATHISAPPTITTHPTEIISAGPEGNYPPLFYRPMMIMKYAFGYPSQYLEYPPDLVVTKLGGRRIWDDFIQEISRPWHITYLDMAALLDVIERWNERVLRPRKMEALLCLETGHPPWYPQHYSLYLTYFAFDIDLRYRFDHLSEDAERCDILDATGAVQFRLEAEEVGSPAIRRQGRPPNDYRVDNQWFTRSPTDMVTSAPSALASPGVINYTQFHQPLPESDTRRKVPDARDGADGSQTTPRMPRDAMRNVNDGWKGVLPRRTELQLPPFVIPMPATPPAPATGDEEMTGSVSSEVIYAPPRPGVSPLLRRRLPGTYLSGDPSFDFQSVYSVEELSASASNIPMKKLIIWHKNIPPVLIVQQEPWVTVAHVLTRLAEFLQEQVPEPYLLDDDTLERLIYVSGQRVQASTVERGAGPRVDQILSVDWIWSNKCYMAGFIEHANGSWELEIREDSE